MAGVYNAILCNTAFPHRKLELFTPPNVKDDLTPSEWALATFS